MNRRNIVFALLSAAAITCAPMESPPHRTAVAGVSISITPASKIYLPIRYPRTDRRSINTYDPGVVASTYDDVLRGAFHADSAAYDLQRTLRAMTHDPNVGVLEGFGPGVLPTDGIVFLRRGASFEDAQIAAAGVPTSLLDSLAVGPDGFEGREGYVLYSDGARLLVIANEETGFLNASRRILHDLGYRHFLTGSHWEIVPDRPMPIALDYSTFDRPGFYSRTLSLTDNYQLDFSPIAETDAWLRHNQMSFGFEGLHGSSLRFSGAHSWQHIACNPQGYAAIGTNVGPVGAARVQLTMDYFNAHREYILGYKDIPPRTLLTPYPPGSNCINSFHRFDISQPIVREVFKEWARASTTGVAGLGTSNELYVPMTPGDDVYATLSPNRLWKDVVSEALNPQYPRALGSTSPVHASNQVFAIASEANEYLRGEFPGQRVHVGVLAYGAHDMPPVEPVDDDVVVQIEPRVYRTTLGYTAASLLRRWGNSLGARGPGAAPAGVYDYLFGRPTLPSRFSLDAQTHQRWHRDYVQTGRARHFFAEASLTMGGADGPGAYLLSRALWSPARYASNGADLDMDDFVEKAFPAAPVQMRQHFALLSAEQELHMSPQRVAEAIQLLDEAASLSVADSASMARINDLRKWWYWIHINDRLGAASAANCSPAPADVDAMFEVFFQQLPSRMMNYTNFRNTMPCDAACSSSATRDEYLRQRYAQWMNVRTGGDPTCMDLVTSDPATRFQSGGTYRWDRIQTWHQCHDMAEYTPAEISARWQAVKLAHAPQAVVRSSHFPNADSNDVVPIQQFYSYPEESNARPNRCYTTDVGFRRGSRVSEILLYSFFGEDVAFRFYSREARAFRVEAFDRNNAPVLVANSGETTIQELTSPGGAAVVRIPATAGAGAYRVSFNEVERQEAFHVRAAPGYPMSIDIRRPGAASGSVASTGRSFAFVPAGTSQVWADYTLPDFSPATVRFMYFGFQGLNGCSYPSSTCPQATTNARFYPDSFSSSIAVPTSGQNEIVQLELKEAGLQFYNLPNVLSVDPRSLMLPRGLVGSRTIAAAPYTTPTFHIAGAGAFDGDYEEVLDAPPLPAAMVHIAAPGVLESAARYDDFGAMVYYRERCAPGETPSRYILRTAQVGTNAAYVMFDASNPTGEWYATPVIPSHAAHGDILSYLPEQRWNKYVGTASATPVATDLALGSYTGTCTPNP